VAFFSTGAMSDHCLKAAVLLDGVVSSVTHFHTVKPLDEETVVAQAEDADLLVTVEEGIRSGGFGSAVCEALAEHYGHLRVVPKLLRVGIPDAFPSGYGTREDLLEQCGLMPEQIAAAVRARL
jgi:transketolase C-terminal domain/subunit